METGWTRDVCDAPGFFRRRASGKLAAAVAIGFGLGTGPVPASGDDGQPRFCSATATVQYAACLNEVRDDLFTARAVCLNVGDAEERMECGSEAEAERGEGNPLCREQYRARRDLCAALGEHRYDPDFDPAHFDDDFTNLTSPNPYFPLGIGNRWTYAGGDETVSVVVLDETKLIEGVTCLVVNDRVEQDGELVEDTDDWIGQRKDGSIEYCGEIARNYETFEGDVPQEPELVDIEGSWKAGRDGLSGTLFPGSPVEGAVYRQEWSPGNAEDAARVLSTRYRPGSAPELDANVPRGLAELLCEAGDCVVTAEFTPIEPDAFERKYYARGIGLFLEVDAESGDVVQLVDCNFDPRCAALPTP